MFSAGQVQIHAVDIVDGLIENMCGADPAPDCEQMARIAAAREAVCQPPHSLDQFCIDTAQGDYSLYPALTAGGVPAAMESELTSVGVTGAVYGTWAAAQGASVGGTSSTGASSGSGASTSGMTPIGGGTAAPANPPAPATTTTTTTTTATTPAGGGTGGGGAVSHGFYLGLLTFWPEIRLQSPSLDMPAGMPGDLYTKWTGAYGLGLGYTVRFPYGAFRVGPEMRFGPSAQLHDADNVSYYDGTLGMFGGGIGFSAIPVGNDICSLNIDIDFSVGGMGTVEGEANAERGGRDSHWMTYIMLDAGLGPRFTLGAVDLIATIGVGYLWAEDRDVLSGADSETITLGYTTPASGVAGFLNLRLEIPGSK